MRLTHRRSAEPVRNEREHGFILIKFALLLVPLLLMTGLSVDVGYWYNRASDIQKAADAAALAGVVWLPDPVSAKTYALQAAARNGFVDGTDDISIDVEPVPGQNRRLRVTITDNSVGSFLWGNLGGGTIDMARVGVAEYVLPVPLGSPENVFGTDPTLPAAQRMNLWANIHGPRTNSTNGDAFAPACNGAAGGSCATSNPNPTYRASGYLYAIDVPEGVTNMRVQVYDAGLVPRTSENVETGDTNYLMANAATNTAGWNGVEKTTTVWTFYDKDSTELDVADNPVATSALCNGGSTPAWSPTGSARWTIPESLTDTTYKNNWTTLCYRSGTVAPGRYLLRVQTTGLGAGANRYSVRVTAGSTTKPRLSAYGDLSMYNNISAGDATFYLAEVGPEHRGKTLELRLYDPGEVTGDAVMQVITPTGAVATSCTGTHSGSSGGGRFNPAGATLAPCQFQSASASQSARYNGIWVNLAIKIPDNYTCTLGAIPGCWWRIRYQISGQANDTTTWSAQVVGDPVHLVEEDPT